MGRGPGACALVGGSHVTAKPLLTGLVSARKAGSKPGLTRHEQIILEVVCRFGDRQAITERVDGERQMTRAEWSGARTSLIAKRLLSVAGEITVKGRQAIGDDT